MNVSVTREEIKRSAQLLTELQKWERVRYAIGKFKSLSLSVGGAEASNSEKHTGILSIGLLNEYIDGSNQRSVREGGFENKLRKIAADTVLEMVEKMIAEIRKEMPIPLGDKD